MVYTQSQKQKKLDLREVVEGGRDLYNAITKGRVTHSSAWQQEEEAQQALNEQLMGNLI